MKDKGFQTKLGQRIKDRRIELGLSQLELAKKVGYTSKGAISLIENSKRDLTPTQLKKIAIALETNPSYLMGMEDYVHIEYKIDKNKRDVFKKRILEYSNKLTDQNKKNLENYIKLLLKSQN